MGTRQADHEAIAQRCINAGWKVDRGPDGWKVLPPGANRTIPIHLTPSDRNSTTVLLHLEKYGLTEAEKNQESIRARLRKEALDAGRRASEEKANAVARANRNSTAINKAAGPYLVEPEECDLEWLTTPHPAPWMKWMYITPEAAAKILENHNADNRKISPGFGKEYADLILSGNWHLTHQGVAFDTRGMVQDAQHRMAGIVEAADRAPDGVDVKVPFACFVGMPVENFKVIDVGRVRTGAQMFTKEGVKNGVHMVSMLRVIAAYHSENARSFAGNKKLSIVELFSLRDHDPELIGKSLDFASKAYNNRKLRTSIGALAAAHYLISQANGFDNPYVKAFFGGLIENRKYNTNLVLPSADPRAVLRGKVETGRARSPIDPFAWILLSWNNLVTGHHPQYFRYAVDVAPPKILLCLPGDGQPPRALDGEL